MSCRATVARRSREHAQLSDGALAAALRVICELCGTNLEPPADLEPYRRVFRAPIRFNEEAAALVFPAQWLDMPVPYSDPAAHEALKLRLLDIEKAAGVDLRDQLVARRLRAERATPSCAPKSSQRPSGYGASGRRVGRGPIARSRPSYFRAATATPMAGPSRHRRPRLARPGKEALVVSLSGECTSLTSAPLLGARPIRYWTTTETERR